MCRISQKEKYKRKEIITWLKLGGCKAITYFSYKLNLCVLFRSTPNQREKETKRGKARTTKAKFPTKIQPYEVLLIHDDCANYLCFDGKWLAKSIYHISVVWNYDETLACVRFYTPWAVFFYSIGPSVFLMFF